MAQRFSQRMGFSPSKVEIQTDWMDDDLRNSLWNIVYNYLILPDKRIDFYTSINNKDFFDHFWFSFLKSPLDTIPHRTSQLHSQIKLKYFSWDFYEVYDFIEFIVSSGSTYLSFEPRNIRNSFNFVLERELSAYRFVDDVLCPITKDHEIRTIESALENRDKFKGATIHISRSLQMLSDRKSPDYRNSIKESILAVESVCQQITGDSSAELGKALNRLKTIMPIHGALEKGFKSLYGYTSDEGGIRHAMLDEDNLEMEDALYMLVSCSSFVNYLIAKFSKL